MSNNNSTTKKEKQLDNLINLVENHTRTERHLEQYSHIGSEKNKENARDKQKVREDQINTLKSYITNDTNNKLSIEEQIENIADNYSSAEGYLENNFNNMEQEAIGNMQTKQQHRLEQLNNLTNKN